jgi:hypothetical protein
MKRLNLNKKVGHMNSLRGQMGGFGSNLLLHPLLKSLGMEVEFHGFS